MTSHPTKLKLRCYRPQFSIRLLLILMTLVCGYSACWWPTKYQGVDDVVLHQSKTAESNEVHNSLFHRDFVSAVCPLLIKTSEHQFTSGALDEFHCYYFWFFGYVAKLPYERPLHPACEIY